MKAEILNNEFGNVFFLNSNYPSLEIGNCFKVIEKYQTQLLVRICNVIARFFRITGYVIKSKKNYQKKLKPNTKTGSVK